MARHEYTMNLRCAEPSCYEKYQWRCTRHMRPDEVLSTDDTARESVLEVRDRPNLGPRWMPLGGETGGGNGFITGPGFKAFAKDFPAGARLVVTARIELPEGDGDGR